MERRTHAMHQIIAVSVVFDIFQIEGMCNNDSGGDTRNKLNIFVQNLLGLINFDSQRCLIQEVDKQRILNCLDPIKSTTAPIPKRKAAFGSRGQIKSQNQIEKDNHEMKARIDSQVQNQKTKISSYQNKIIVDYFDKAVKLFQDDQMYSV